MPSPPPSPPEDPIPQIIAEFSQVFAFIRRRWMRFAEEIHPDLRGVGMMMLQVILRKGPVTATGLAQMLALDKAVVSRQVTELRRMGLVMAEPSGEDRRVVLLTASDEARRAIERLQGLTSDDYQRRFAEWHPEELEQLRDMLHRFNEAAGDEGGGSGD